MPEQLPLTSDHDYRVATTIDGTLLIFDLRWNSRAAAWYMDVLDPVDETHIVSGVAVLLGALLANVADPRIPGGVFMAIDLSGAGLDATIDDLGTRVIIDHYTGAEIDAL